MIHTNDGIQFQKAEIYNISLIPSALIFYLTLDDLRNQNYILTTLCQVFNQVFTVIFTYYGYYKYWSLVSIFLNFHQFKIHVYFFEWKQTGYFKKTVK